MKESRARFGWFWCNDEEMFPKDPSALDRKMELYAQRGITHVILFGITPSSPSQPEGKIGLPRANPRGRLRSPS